MPVHCGLVGMTFAVCDGPELLVYNGDGSPRWKHFCDGVLVGVRVLSDAVIVLDADGKLTRFRADDGAIRDEFHVDGQASALDLTMDAVALVRGPTDLVLVQGGSQTPLGQGATSAATFGPNSESLGAGWPNGTFRVLELSTGVVWGEQSLGAGVTAVCWSARGSWLVAAGPELFVVSGDGQQVEAKIPLSGPCVALASAADGVLVAAQIGDNRVDLMETHTFQQAGFLGFRRPVEGIAWGRSGNLLVGLDDGDASLIEVFVGGSIRTEPHPGRGRNNWNFEDKVEKDVLRGAAAHSRAGDEAIARYEGYKPEGWKWWQIALIVMVGLSFTCMGCTGCSGLLYYLRTSGII